MAQTMFDKAVVFSVSCSRFGLSKKINPKMLEEAGLDPKQVEIARLKASKILLEHEALDAIKQYDTETRHLFDPPVTLTLPVEHGMKLLPISKWEWAQGVLVERRDHRRSVLVPAACKVYEELVVQAEKELGLLFNARDYPGLDEFEARYRMTWCYYELSAPGAMRKSNPQIYAEQQAQIEESVKNAIASGEGVVAESFGSIIDRFVDILTPGQDGKKKRVHDTLLGNAREFFEAWKGMRDVVDLPQLDAQVKKLQKLIEGVDTPGIKTDESLRRKVLAGAQKIGAALPGLVFEVKGRALRMDMNVDD